MKAEHRIVYKCGVCLRTSWTAEACHGRPMVECDAGCEGDDCTQPVMDNEGRLRSLAPKWWVYRHRRDRLPAEQ
jgi:hypothetical protein